MRSPLILTTLASVASALILAPPASAATTIGDTTAAPNILCGGGKLTFIQVASPNDSYAVPSAGVITSWQYRASSQAATMNLKVVRSVGGPSYRTVGESAAQAIVPSALNNFPTRIPVAAGDEIGFFVDTPNPIVCATSATLHDTAYITAEAAPNTTTSYLSAPGSKLPLGAVVEPDADADGYGDETQDSCPTSAAVQVGPCPDTTAPETEITKQPKRKTKAKRAELRFSSAEAGVSFECSFDGAAFTPCISPTFKTVGKGKHAFQVRAVDAAGNADSTPAIATWKVVKKKPKRHGGGKG